MHQDSAGREIIVGDRVRWRGRNYTIKSFKAERDPIYGVPLIDFEEPLHLGDEVPNEFTVDVVR